MSFGECTCHPITTPARGESMPQTPEQFQRMGDMYEAELLRLKDELSRAKQTENELRQTITRLGEKAAHWRDRAVDAEEDNADLREQLRLT